MAPSRSVHIGARRSSGEQHVEVIDMARSIAIGLLALLLLGGVAGFAYEAGIAAGTAAGAAGTGVAAAHPYVSHPFAFGLLPFLGLLVPLLFLFLIVGLGRALFYGARGPDHGWSGRSRMLDEWHRSAHEHPVDRKVES